MKNLYTHNCPHCQYLGSEKLQERMVDVYYCKEENPLPTMIVRFGEKEHEYSSLDVRTLLELAKDPRTQTLSLMVKFYKQFTLEQARVLH